MYPKTIEKEENQNYFSEAEYFDGKFNYIHSYLHTDYKYKMHSHQFYEINIIMSGKGKHYIEKSAIDITEGDVFVIPPEVGHGYLSESTLDIFHILIKTEFLHRYSEELAEIDGFDLLFDIEPQIRQGSGKNFNINSGPHIISSFGETLLEMSRAERQGRYAYLNILTLAFISRLCERICGDFSDISESDIVGVMEYIKNNLDEKITIDGLSEFAHMSPSTLTRKFKTVTGQSPLNYVLCCRIAKAKKLIEKADMRKTEIAYVCGFYDIAHMNKYLNKEETSQNQKR